MELGSRKDAIEERILGGQQEMAELQSWASRREIAIRQVASAETIVGQLRAHLSSLDFETGPSILQLVIEKVVVTDHRLEPGPAGVR